MSSRVFKILELVGAFFNNFFKKPAYIRTSVFSVYFATVADIHQKESRDL